MTEIVVSKFGGTSVADFDAMNRSADIVLSDTNVRLVVLSASAGITNLLVALAEGMEPGERFATLDAIRKIQFDILDRLRHPNVIREEIERLLENITILAEAASLATIGKTLTDELVSHGELMSTLLFVEILRERDVQGPLVRRAQSDAYQRSLWSCGTGRRSACGTGRAAVAPAPERNVGHYSGLYRQ